jgi:hypothetical protein
MGCAFTDTPDTCKRAILHVAEDLALLPIKGLDAIIESYNIFTKLLACLFGAACLDPTVAPICQSQGCCDYDCDNLPNGWVQWGLPGVNCRKLESQRCCLGTNGCGYYCKNP